MIKPQDHTTTTEHEEDDDSAPRLRGLPPRNFGCCAGVALIVSALLDTSAVSEVAEDEGQKE